MEKGVSEQKREPGRDTMTEQSRDYVMRSLIFGETRDASQPLVRVMAVVIVTGASRWTSLRETTVLVSLADIRSAQGHWPGSYLILTWNV
jgi:hypothetical protein